MKFKIFTLITILSISCISIQNIEAQNFPKNKVEQSTKGKEYIYFDGEKQIKVYLQEDLVAEFNGNTNSYVKTIDPSSNPVKKAGIVNVYKIQNSIVKNQLKQGKFSKSYHSSAPVSEVFRSEAGTLMALPGNIILTFKEGVSESQIKNFLNKHGLILIKKQTILNKDYYIVKYKPGIASLELANQLRNEPIIETSQPDWWKEYSLR
ncbi:MAG: hypothetical protein KatS3mg002_1753 [Candidatus Woesearchaeota archaeon]|nr:MAG: hypothetical protein KatS3mg002_1753 [Candidatus Woesearchaeota archaeon]